MHVADLAALFKIYLAWQRQVVSHFILPFFPREVKSEAKFAKHRQGMTTLQSLSELTVTQDFTGLCMDSFIEVE